MWERESSLVHALSIVDVDAAGLLRVLMSSPIAPVVATWNSSLVD